MNPEPILQSYFARRVRDALHSMNIPGMERKLYYQTLVVSPSHVLTCRSLLQYLQEVNTRWVAVLRSIERREECLNRFVHLLREVKSVRVSFQSPRDVILQLKRTLRDLRNLTLLTVEGILWWRKKLTRPFPFCWNGQNYLLKILEDVNALAKVAEAEQLKLNLHNNPLLYRGYVGHELCKLEQALKSQRKQKLTSAWGEQDLFVRYQQAELDVLGEADNAHRLAESLAYERQHGWSLRTLAWDVEKLGVYISPCRSLDIIESPCVSEDESTVETSQTVSFDAMSRSGSFRV